MRDVGSVQPFVHPKAEVSSDARLGARTRVWAFAQVRELATLGEECVVGTGAYIDRGVTIGDRVKIENNALVFAGAVVECGVFIGPSAVITNDRNPRAITPGGALKTASDWTAASTRVKRGASIGAGAIIMAGVTIGEFAMVGAGSVVTKDIPDNGLVMGVPARLHGYVCSCGVRLPGALDSRALLEICRSCGRHPSEKSSGSRG